MSEDIKDFLNSLEEYANGFDNVIAPHEDTVKDFLSYFDELQDSRKKAIKYIKEKIIGNENYSNHLWTIDGLVIKRLLEILGDKENE